MFSIVVKEDYKVDYFKAIKNKIVDTGASIVNQVGGAQIVCPNCSTKLNKDALFCSKCGYKIEKVIESPSNSKPEENKGQAIANRVHACVGCGAPLPYDKKSEILTCEYCGTRNINAFFDCSLEEDITPNGNVRFLFGF